MRCSRALARGIAPVSVFSVMFVVAGLALAALATTSCSRATRPPPRVSDGLRCPATCEQTTRYRLDPAFTNEENDAIHEAMGLWTAATGGRACFRAGGTDLIVVRATKRLDLRPYDDGWHGHSGLYRQGTIWLVVPELTRGELVDVTAHEIGHHLGLGHVTDTSDTIMHPRDGRRKPGELLPARDRAAYCLLHTCVCSR
jgi:hypothetical protein